MQFPEEFRENAHNFPRNLEKELMQFPEQFRGRIPAIFAEKFRERISAMEIISSNITFSSASRE
jgi:hypothetical protein